MTAAVPDPLAAPARPWRDAGTIALFAEALFLFRLTTPSRPMFDEVHYVPAARTLLRLSGAVNAEHPLLGKTLIAAGIALFGDTALGWRIAATLAGAASVAAIYALLWSLYRSPRTATIGAVLTTVNITVFIQARIAMLDGFMAAFLLAGIAALANARDLHRSGSAWRRWLAGSALLGLAVGCKWSAVPVIVMIAAGFALVRLRSRGTQWPAIPVVGGVAALVGIATLAYLATFAPAFFYVAEPLTLGTILPWQAHMYALQTQVLPHHTYQSAWWSWPLMLRPIWYLFEPIDGAVRGVLMIGNPAVMWGGLAALCYIGWRRDPRGLALAALWAGAYLPFAIVPKTPTFFYYYYLPSILLCPVIAAALALADPGGRRRLDTTFVLLAIGLFAYFYPIIAALPLADPQHFRHWMWLDSWP